MFELPFRLIVASTLLALSPLGLTQAQAPDSTNTQPSFGRDSSEWANDGECDDPRFVGPGMTSTTLLNSDMYGDATDCREAFEAGRLMLRTDFGRDLSQWAKDGECDDPRFEGPGMTKTTLLDSDILGDATDCIVAFELGKLSLRHFAAISGLDAGRASSRRDTNQLIARGSAFLASATGHVVTNAHVVSECRQVALPNGTLLKMLGIDEASDLALLKLENLSGVEFLHLRSGRGVQLGEDVVVAGFPLPGLLSPDLNVTAGSVSSLSGLGQDRRLFQLTAPVQPGNSGGPVLDMSGNVVGVVVSKLDAMAVAEETGDVPQNVNFAVSLGTLESFLDSFGVDYSSRESSESFARPIIAATARTATLQLECRG